MTGRSDEQGGDLGRRMGLVDRFAYRFFWSLLWLFSKAWFRFRVVGKEHLPRDEPYILSPVHRSYLDTPVGGMVTARRLRFLGKESLWKSRLGGRFLTIVGGFPVERGTADRAALRACQEVLERGEPMVMFPEGTRRFGFYQALGLRHVGLQLNSLGGPGDRARYIEILRDYLAAHREELTEELRQALQVVFDEAQQLAGRPARPRPEEADTSGE